MGGGGLNLLVNNAGVLFKESVLDCSAEIMQKSFDTNVMGPINITKVSKNLWSLLAVDSCAGRCFWDLQEPILSRKEDFNPVLMAKTFRRGDCGSLH